MKQNITSNKKNTLRTAGGSLQQILGKCYLKQALRSYEYLLLLLFFTVLVSCACPTEGPTDPKVIPATNILIEQGEAIAITNDSSNISGTLIATVLPSNHTDGDVTWVSSNTNYVTIMGIDSVTGEYQTAAFGTTTITATVGEVSTNIIFGLQQALYFTTNFEVLVTVTNITTHFFSNVVTGNILVISNYVTNVPYTTNGYAAIWLTNTLDQQAATHNVAATPYRMEVISTTNLVSITQTGVETNTVISPPAESNIAIDTEVHLVVTNIDRTNDGDVNFLYSSNLVATTNFSGIDFSARDFSYLNLSGFNLSDINLSNANLSFSWFNNANLIDADLRRANLTNANFTNANLTNADLRRANLTNANFTNANLINIGLSGGGYLYLRGQGFGGFSPNLMGAELIGAELIGDNLRDANLSHANLSHANLTNADLRRANLTNADLTGANITNIGLSGGGYLYLRGQGFGGFSPNLMGSQLIGAELIGDNLSNANLSNANLERADLRKVDLRDANLRDANLRDANLSNTDGVQVRLNGADMRNAILNNVDLFNALLRNANLSNANLSNANLDSVSLGNTDLRGSQCIDADLSSAVLDNADLRNANFSNANLFFADLRNANFSNANFTNANLTQVAIGGEQYLYLRSVGFDGFAPRLNNADFRDADLAGADLSHALVFNTQFDRANLVNANLSNAQLIICNLPNANFSNANLRNADLNNVNVTDAIFHNTMTNGLTITIGGGSLDDDAFTGAVP